MSSLQLDALSVACRPFVEVAQRFCHTELGLDLAMLAAGSEGLRNLVKVVDRQRLTGDCDEDRFVEGVGAWLALLLAQHVGIAAHRQQAQTHRLMLGTWGCFDPFVAIDAALNAAQARRELVHRVQMAEAEASGEGPVSRVVGAFATALQAMRPELRVVWHLDYDVRLPDETAVDLSRVARATADQSAEGLLAAAAKVVALLPGPTTASAHSAWSHSLHRLLPRLVGPAFLEELPAASDSQGSLALQHLAGDVHIALVIDYQSRCRFLRQDEIDATGMAWHGVLQHALSNLAARSAKARLSRLETADGVMLQAHSGDGLDAARLLLPAMVELMQTTLATPGIVAAIPHRDALMACGDLGTLSMLQRAVKDAAARAPHRISTHLFRCGESPFSALPSPGVA